jgi:hypothetical protein
VYTIYMCCTRDDRNCLAMSRYEAQFIAAEGGRPIATESIVSLCAFEYKSDPAAYFSLTSFRPN